MTTAQQGAERAGELAALREAVGDLIDGSGGIAAARLRLEAEPGYDEQAWRLLGADMGLAGLGIAEDLGGVGGGLAELTVVAEELGRSLLPVPFFSSTVLAGQILARCPDTAGGRAGPALGRRPNSPRSPAPTPTDAGGPSACRSRRRRTEPRGGCAARREFVLDGANAAHLVVAARTPSGCDLFLVGGDSEGVQRRATGDAGPDSRAGVSQLRRRGRHPADHRRRRCRGGGAPRSTSPWWCSRRSRSAARRRALTWRWSTRRSATSSAVRSAASRRSSTSSLTCCYWSRWAVRPLTARYWSSRTRPRLAEAAAVAKIWCSDAFTTVTTENVHIHGGIGFTWEHDAHLYFRRARADEGLLGDATVHRERLAALLSW